MATTKQILILLEIDQQYILLQCNGFIMLFHIILNSVKATEDLVNLIINKFFSFDK